MALFDKVRSEISKRTWRIRKKLGGKGKCAYCSRSIFTGGTSFKGRPYHATCLGFLKMGLTPKQAGVENPSKLWHLKRLAKLNESLDRIPWDLGPAYQRTAGRVDEEEYAALQCPSCHNPIANPKRLRIGWCSGCGAKVGVRNPKTVKCVRCGKAVEDIAGEFFSTPTTEPLCDECYTKRYHERKLADWKREAIEEAEHIIEPDEEGRIFPQNPVNPRPPAAWWTHMMARARAQYPKFGKERLSQILGGIWYRYPEATRARIIREYDQNPAKHLTQDEINKFVSAYPEYTATRIKKVLKRQRRLYGALDPDLIDFTLKHTHYGNVDRMGRFLPKDELNPVNPSMTIAEIKEQLPLVNIKVAGVVVKGKVSGRKEPFAYVSIPAPGVHYHKAYKHQSWQFSWPAVERAINSNTALEI